MLCSVLLALLLVVGSLELPKEGEIGRESAEREEEGGRGDEEDVVLRLSLRVDKSMLCKDSKRV